MLFVVVPGATVGVGKKIYCHVARVIHSVRLPGFESTSPPRTRAIFYVYVIATGSRALRYRSDIRSEVSLAVALPRDPAVSFLSIWLDRRGARCRKPRANRR